MDTVAHGPIAGGLPPPSGVVPDFAHPYSLQKYGVATQVVCLITTTVLVFLRMYAKVFITKTLGYEDCKAPYMWYYPLTDVIANLQQMPAVWLGYAKD